VVSAQDYRINAEVRRTLVSRWIDVSALQIGTTNGVVYLLGTFEPLVEDALQRAGQTQENDPTRRIQRLIQLVEKDLRRIRGLRDVVFNLRNARKKGGTWRVIGPRGEDPVADDREIQRALHRRRRQEEGAKEGPEHEEPDDPAIRIE
jgi:hypothetical protein